MYLLIRFVSEVFDLRCALTLFMYMKLLDMSSIDLAQGTEIRMLLKVVWLRKVVN